MAARTTAASAPATISDLELPMVRRKLWVHNLYYSMRSWVASFRSVATLCSYKLWYSIYAVFIFHLSFRSTPPRHYTALGPDVGFYTTKLWADDWRARLLLLHACVGRH